MKILVTYSSKTGNTKLVAEAVAAALDTDEVTLLPVGEAVRLERYELIIVGFWIDKGRPDAAMQRFLKTLPEVKTAFFFTLGAEADSNHAVQCRQKAKSYFAPDVLVGDFCCQGKISPGLIKVLKLLPGWFPHGPNPERIARWERAATHPDADDLRGAADCFRQLRQHLWLTH